MPIKITAHDPREEIAWLCDADWELPTQLKALLAWLEDYEKDPVKGGAVADIGFSVRPDAFGGGAILGVEAMRRFADARVEIHFSEYPQGGTARD